MHFARSLLVLMALVGAAAQVTLPTAAKFCGDSTKGKRCPSKVTLGSGENTVISVGGTPILDLKKDSATVTVNGGVTFGSRGLAATIVGNVALNTTGNTLISSGNVVLTSTGRITIGGGQGVYYPAAVDAGGVIEVGDPKSQLCPGADGPLVLNPLAGQPLQPATVPSNMLGTMAIKKFGQASLEPLTHICALYPFAADGTPFPNPNGFFTPGELGTAAAIIPIWLPLRTVPFARPWLKLTGQAA